MPSKYWYTLSLLVFILVTVSLVDIGISLKLFDFSFMAEFKALLTLIFSFAASFLLLSFVWLIQKGPLYAPWTTLDGSRHHSSTLYPRGLADSLNSLDVNQADSIHTVSHTVDLPPNYDIALSNSKPLNKTYLDSGKSIITHPVTSDGDHSTSPYINQVEVNNLACQQHSYQTDHASPIDCQICMENIATSNLNKVKDSKSHNVAQITMNILRGPVELAQQDRNLHSISPQENSSEEAQVYLNERKQSNCQLDVSQLQTTYGSPPKYHDLLHNGSLAIGIQFQNEK